MGCINHAVDTNVTIDKFKATAIASTKHLCATFSRMLETFDSSLAISSAKADVGPSIVGEVHLHGQP